MKYKFKFPSKSEIFDFIQLDRHNRLQEFDHHHQSDHTARQYLSPLQLVEAPDSLNALVYKFRLHSIVGNLIN